MKKIRCLLFLVFLAGAGRSADAQIAVVTAPILETVMEVTHVDQIIYYAQSIEQMVQSAVNSYNQLQNMIRMEERALQNLKGIADVKSWDDFMNWYNRQLYLERQAENKFKTLGVKIGGKTYRVADAEDIPDALKTSYVDYWKEDFTDEQRREMWLNLGLSPANYAYVQTWKEKEKALARIILTKPEVINEDSMASLSRNYEIQGILKEDKAKPDGEKMGEKGLLSLMLEVLLDTNKTTHQAAYDQAEANAWQLTAQRAGEVPPNPPRLSEMWGKELFSPLVED
jgi:ASC-1-like (ASCH) protein